MISESAASAADVEAVIDAIALKMAVELGAELVRVPGAVAIRYPAPLRHPWPREVDVSLDIMASDLGAARAAASLTDAAHRAHVFGCDVTGDAAAIEAAGYDGCWNTQLLAIDLDGAPPAPAADLVLEPVEREDQLDELNALEPEFRSYRPALGRPELFDLLGRRDGAAVAKGQVVFASPHAAYVADMYTHPSARNAGVASALLAALHAEALRRGARRAVLIPSLMAAQAGFYQKRGYGRVSVDAVLLSKP